MNPGTQVLIVAIVGGVAAQWMGRILRLPAIIPLLLLGIALGPQGLHLMPKPEFALGKSLSAIVALGVAIILFEGGMSLNRHDLRLAPKAVIRLITLGAAISFAGGALCAHYIAGMEWSVSLLYGSLMIVTGPTVIIPLLKNVRVVRRVHTVLLWEGILIDAVGAITAVVMLELILQKAGFFHAGFGFFGAMIVGPMIGAAGGWFLAKLLASRKKSAHQDEEFDRLLAIAGAIGIYGLSESIFTESGLGAITCAGLVTANMLRHEVEELRRFKGVLTTLLVSVLFMMLAANFDLAQLIPLWPNGFLVIAAMMLIVRPLSVMVCTQGSKLPLREKIFISWVGPRGIVAASVASLFSILLKEHGQQAAGETLMALTFSTIIVTVMLNGLTAYPLAWLLGIQVKSSDGVLIVGGNELALRVAAIFENHGFPVLIVDMNPNLCDRAREAGFRVVQGDALDADYLFQQDLSGIGSLLAMTSSSTVNARACAQTASALKFGQTASVVTRTTGPEESERLSAVNAGVAFATQLDIGALLNLLRDNKAAARSVTIPAKNARLVFRQPFLPLVISNRDGMRPYIAGELLVAGTKLIGLQFDLPLDQNLPFTPAYPGAGNETVNNPIYEPPVLIQRVDCENSPNEP